MLADVRPLVCCCWYEGRAAKVESASQAAAKAIAATVETMKSEEELMSSDLVPPLPSALRRRLVLDWERLTRKQHILRLPARLPVLTVLAAFLHDHQANKPQTAAAEVDSAKQEAVMQVCEGLLCYFERCLPAVLLYRIERPQMQWLAEQHSLVIPVAGQPNASLLFSLQHVTQTLPPVLAAVNSSSSSSSSVTASPSTALTYWLPEPSADHSSFTTIIPQWSGVYGVEHLIRLLCKLPAILRDGEVEWMTEQRKAVRYTLAALYKWLSAHEELIYDYSAYEHADKEYMAKLQQPHHIAPHSQQAANLTVDEQQQQRKGSASRAQLPHRHLAGKAERKMKQVQR